MARAPATLVPGESTQKCEGNQPVQFGAEAAPFAALPRRSVLFRLMIKSPRESEHLEAASRCSPDATPDARPTKHNRDSFLGSSGFSQKPEEAKSARFGMVFKTKASISNRPSAGDQRRLFRVDENLTSKARLIFVSHSSSDTWVAKQIAREIEARGGTPFLDEAGVDAGADFEEDILKFLERAHELVVLLTPWALDRPYVWAEIGAAWGRRIPIVALLLGITPTELQTRPGVPVLLKKRDLLQLNEIDIYLGQLAARIAQHEG
jgi:hypothetical protein